MLWGRAQHYQWFSLGMAPLSGLEEHALAPAWHKLGRMVQRYGETFYPFEGLRKYKEKILPVWRPRYLAAPGGLGMAGALLDVTSLISGGVSKVLSQMTHLVDVPARIILLSTRMPSRHGCAGGGARARRRAVGHAPAPGASGRTCGGLQLWALRRSQRVPRQRRTA